MKVRSWWLLAFMGVLASACVPTEAAPAGNGGQEAISGPVLVLAAASLTSPFEELAAAFESSHPGVDVRISTGASSALREQLFQGQPGDVFASADQKIMDEVIGEGLVDVDSVRPLTANTMVVGVGIKSRGDIVSIEDLSRQELLIGLCAQGVPCGDLAREVLAGAEVDAAVDTFEPNARALVTKIADGELDGGLVYASDASANNKVVSVAIDESINATTLYPIAVLRESPNPTGAEAFMEFTLSAQGQDLLASYGFIAP